MKSDKDGNFPGHTDGKFVSEGTDSTRALLGDAVGKCKSDTDGN